ncbi:MAG: hypothetical protein KF767_08790 [Bdellovibrionaceae bacterium]|nr:hypothetical protein [Pseudobdellovibrionaceae bacterium]
MKKPREFWIERRACGTFMVWDRKQDGMIHVREVLPEAEPEFPEAQLMKWVVSQVDKDIYPTIQDVGRWAWAQRGKVGKS